nr:RibD family protein [Gammaproteobacteria bacterium]
VPADIRIDTIDPLADIVISLGEKTEPGITSDTTPETTPGTRTPGWAIAATEAFSIQTGQRSTLEQSLGSDELKTLTTYLPYALLPCFAARHQRTFAISHFAQTLDGRIATHNGDSRWVGNQENLLHAHRMRALCDAILIGANTLRRDQPRLTVRHVKGDNPLRVVIGNGAVCDNHECDDGMLHIQTRHSPGTCNANCAHLSVPSAGDTLDCPAILQALYQRGIQSVYIEGGARTTSAFLQQQMIDQVQVHIAPRILGSGLSGFALGKIDAMNQAMDFRNPRFVPVGDAVMFIGEK